MSATARLPACGTLPEATVPARGTLPEAMVPARGTRPEPMVLVQVFAKAPIAGQVKTRLAGSLGSGGAAELHRRLTRRTLAEACRAQIGPIELWTTSGAQSELLAGVDLAQCVVQRLQPEGDLGLRMGVALLRGLEQAASVLLIGVDVPQMEASDLLAARDALAAGHHAVFGPVQDGGYWLVGLTRAALDATQRARTIAALFDAVPWSTPEVMQATRARLAALGLRWHELPPRWDLDRPEDLRRLMGEDSGAGLLAGLPLRR